MTVFHNFPLVLDI